MQKTSLPQLQPHGLSFGEFFTALIHSFEKQGIRPCILRNYEGFPAANLGRDVDFLIRSPELPRVIQALRSIQGIRIVGYAERSYAVHMFVEGVHADSKSRALQLDFLWGFSWRGLSYLRADDVLQAAITRRADDLIFLIPSPVHEAILSLLSSVLVGGWLKEKYFAAVQRTFTNNRAATITALSFKFGQRTATRLVDSVTDGDRPRILACVRPLRIAVSVRGLLRIPLRSAFTVVRYYAHEFALRYSSKSLEKVWILGSSSSRKTEVIERLITMLRCSAVVVESRHSGPRLSPEENPSVRNEGSDPIGKTKTGSLISMARIVEWVMEEWLREFAKARNLTLRISESLYYDLIAATPGHIYDVPLWFTRLMGKLLPSPDLWILLDPTNEPARSNNCDALTCESDRRPDVHCACLKKKVRHMTLDASKPVDALAEDAYAAIIETLAQRTDLALMKRS